MSNDCFNNVVQINILYVQTIYEFTMYITWITFGYEHWKTIHDEIGR